MRIAHTCASCGFDLTRTAAPIDPVYGLSIVVCPECRAAVVRREHPTMVWSRWVGRVMFAAASAVVRIVGVAMLTAAILALSWLVWEQLKGRSSGSIEGDATVAAVQIIVWLVVSVVAGLAIGFWFAHFRSVAISIGWFAWVVFTLHVPAAVYLIAEMADSGVASRDELRQILADARLLLPNTYIVIAASCLISGVMVPLGRRAGSSLVRLRRRFAWRAARRRRKNSWMGQLLARA